MKNRIGRKLVGLALAASMLLPAPLAIAGAGDRQGDSINAPEVIRVGGGDGYRYWRDDDRRDRYRHDDRSDRYRHDDRRDRYHDDRYSRRDDRRRYDDRRDYRRYSDRYHDDRRHDHRHKHRRKKGHDHDAAPFIFGGIALGTILLLQAIENDRRRR